ncbi:MAG: UDP-N-acetylglucosamine--N-acetylmuramyl-(pentapeptide) pyrophosphoryl-undecaprenol N-acetylglucosamine transferase, partial [Gemmatimonadetes bacterium]|nr:UDP-N-acetylglucosamine--N-acetylmuramyl-(pentapeptide) pyrophosphoryl-undecaprenol N-acetylglucosamine transferase [Gemmatimonadota bacterium]
MHEGDGVVAVFAGGGTGGHLYPALALANALVELRPDVHPVFVGARRGVEARVLPERGVEHLLLPVRGVDRGAGFSNWRVVPALLHSLQQVGDLFRRRRPEVVVVTGGYAGGPAGLAAILAGVPLVLQEQNSVPGVVTRALSRFAREIHVAFPEVAERLPTRARGRVRVSGNPIEPPRSIDRADARAAFGLDPEGTVALIVGGSQGSRALNEAVLDAVSGVAAGRHRAGRAADLPSALQRQLDQARRQLVPPAPSSSRIPSAASSVRMRSASA